MVCRSQNWSMFQSLRCCLLESKIREYSKFRKIQKNWNLQKFLYVKLKIPAPGRPMLLCKLLMSDSDITASTSPAIPDSSAPLVLILEGRDVLIFVGNFLVTVLNTESLFLAIVCNLHSIHEVSAKTLFSLCGTLSSLILDELEVWLICGVLSKSDNLTKLDGL